MRIRIERQSSGIWTEVRVIFPYDEVLVDIIRSVPGRRWNKDGRYWTIPETEINPTARLFHNDGTDVYVDGEIWEPPTKKQAKPPPSDPGPRHSTNPFMDLMTSLPGHLRQPTYKALCKVFHPDIGGDKVLMQQLNAAWQMYERNVG